MDKTVEKQEGPLITVVVTVWNRSEEVVRCLKGVFEQDFDDYEIVAVDDGSTDKTVEVMRRFTDPRLRIVALPKNRGMTAALHAGTLAARGRWHLKMDSDWVLRPGALRKLAAMAREAEPDVGVIGGCAESDRGDNWPATTPPEGPFGYLEYLKWIDTDGATDYLCCRRREVFEKFQFPTNRGSSVLLNLQVARHWKMWISRETLATAYTNSPNRITDGTTADIMQKRHQMALDRAEIHEKILVQFGEDFRKHAPFRLWADTLRTAQHNFRAGRRLRGARYALAGVASRPWSTKAWGTLVLGLLGPRLIRRIGRSRIGRAFKH